MSRDIKRNMARRMMEIHGARQINKKKYFHPMQTDANGNSKKVSFFALHWKDYLNPESDYRKDLDRKLKAMTARFNRTHGTHFHAPWPVSKYGSDVYRQKVKEA